MLFAGPPLFSDRAGMSMKLLAIGDSIGLPMTRPPFSPGEGVYADEGESTSDLPPEVGPLGKESFLLSLLGADLLPTSFLAIVW